MIGYLIVAVMINYIKRMLDHTELLTEHLAFAKGPVVAFSARVGGFFLEQGSI